MKKTIFTLLAITLMTTARQSLTAQEVQIDAAALAKKNEVVAKIVEKQLQNKSYFLALASITTGVLGYLTLGMAAFRAYETAGSTYFSVNDRVAAIEKLIAAIGITAVLGWLSHAFFKASEKAEKEAEQISQY